MNHRQTQFGPLQIGIVLLTVATAVIHFTLEFPSVLFILNGLGYLVLLAALYLPIPQLVGFGRQVRWVLMGFTVLTIVLWAIMGARVTIGYIDKVIEIVLIVLLWLEGRGESS